MKVFLLCCFVAILGPEPLGAVPPQGFLRDLSQESASPDTSLLQPRDIAYADAMEFARFLHESGINVKSVHRSKLEGFFRGVEKAAFFRTDKGVVEVIFLPDPAGAEEIRVTEERKGGSYLYSFQGQPYPNPSSDRMDASRPMYFLMHGNWFIVPENEDLYDALRRALT